MELKKAAYHLKQCEPYTPWLDAAEREIKELKEGASCKLLQYSAPKCLRNDCLELNTYIRSNSAHDLYKLDKEAPKTVMSDEMLDISQFCEIEWFELVMF